MITAGDLCRRLEGTLEGDPDRPITAIRPPATATPTDISYIADGADVPEGCAAGVLLVGAAREIDAGPARTVIRHEHPRLAFGRAIAALHPEPAPSKSVDPTAVVDPSAELADGVTVGAGAVIGPGVKIGAGCIVGAGCVLMRDITLDEGCTLHPRVTLYPGSKLGLGVRILAGAVIGSDGFGFEPGPSGPERIPHVGGVTIGDHAEIGANCTIDRGVLDDTVIGPLVKLDNMIHVAHNCLIGAGTMMAAQVGIAGSTKVGSGVIFAGQSGAAGHIEIGDGVRVGAKSAVLRSVPPGKTVLGIPAADAEPMKRALLTLTRLPEMRRELRELADRLDAIDAGTPSEEAEA